MKNKTKAQLIELLEASENRNSVLTDKDINGWGLLEVSHKKLKHLKRIVKRDAQVRHTQRVIRGALNQFNREERKKFEDEIKRLESKIQLQHKIWLNDGEQLNDCENEKEDLKIINKYLEQRVSVLTIRLSEYKNGENESMTNQEKFPSKITEEEYLIRNGLRK